MMENMAITEKELFASVIAPEVIDKDTELEIKKNIGLFLKTVPFNIFRNEYFVLYEAIKSAHKYSVIMSYAHFNQIILNNIEKLTNSENVDMDEIVSDTNDAELSKEEFISTCCLAYEEISEMPLQSSRFMFNLELYIKAWSAQKLNQYFVDSYKINTEGMKIGKTFLQGPEDADAYYTKNSNKVKQLFNLGDDKLETIHVGPEGYAHYIEDKSQKIATDRVSYTGMEYVDEQIGDLGRGTVLLVQGPSGGGKTRVTSNIAYNALVSGQNGVFFALEGKPRRAVALLIARHLVEKYDCDVVDDDMIYKGTYPPEYSELVEAAEFDLFNNEEYGRVTVIPSPVYDEDIEGILEDVWDNQYEFSWVVLDYSSLVRSRTKETVTAMLTELMPKLETSAQSFKGQGYLLVIPHQLTRTAVEALIKGTTNSTIIGSADAIAVMKSAHIALTIYTDAELKMKDMAQMICTKTRHSEGFEPRDVYAKLGVCFFSDLPE